VQDAAAREGQVRFDFVQLALGNRQCGGIPAEHGPLVEQLGPAERAGLNHVLAHHSASTDRVAARGTHRPRPSTA